MSAQSATKESVMTGQNTLEENKRIVRAYIDTAFGQHRPDLAADYLAPEVKWHGGTLGTVEGREQVLGVVRSIITGLPDLHPSEQAMIAEGDTVAARLIVEGTHQGVLLGISPTGRRVRWDGVDIYRLANGKIVEEWAADDVLSILYQVGAYTPPWIR